MQFAEIARYMGMGGRPLDGELERRVAELVAEAPVEARGVWSVEGDVLYLCGTIGAKFDAWQRRLALSSSADALIAQAIGAAAIEEEMDRLEAEAKAAAGGEWNVRRSPGYGPMPLSESETILRKLDATRRVGVACTVDFLLMPTKSVTAICRRK